MNYSLSEFLDKFSLFCAEQKITYCFARNYDDLPTQKQSGDLDMIISRNCIDDIINWIQNDPELAIVNRVVKKDMCSIFLFGISWGNHFNAIQIDFFHEISWKGIPFLPVDNVLMRSKALSKEKKHIRRPDPIDEMVISFFSTVMNHGLVKEEYWKKWRNIIQKKPQMLRDKFKRRMDEFYAHALIDHIERDDKEGILKNIWRWRIGFFKKQWYEEGLHSLLWVLHYFWCEFKVRVQTKKIFRMAFFGVDGAGKTTLLHAVATALIYFSKEQKNFHVRPFIFTNKNDNPKAILHNPHAKPNRSKILSIIKLFYFMVIYWIDLIKWRREPSIEIYDRYFHDIIVDPKRYRYGASEKWLHFFSYFLPKLDLVILVDIDAETAQSRKQEVTFEETKSQVKAYRQMVKNYFKNPLILSGKDDLESNAQIIQERIVEILKAKHSA